MYVLLTQHPGNTCSHYRTRVAGHVAWIMPEDGGADQGRGLDQLERHHSKACHASCPVARVGLWFWQLGALLDSGKQQLDENAARKIWRLPRMSWKPGNIPRVLAKTPKKSLV